MMTRLPLEFGTLHLVGIGGIGMSGIAEILKNLGYRVQGSDIAETPNITRLRSLEIPVAIGHDAANLKDAAAVVVSSAIKSDNPELQAARAAHIPVVRRSEMLAELMRLKWAVAIGGTHGKTTTTSLIAAVLDAAGLDPTVINGGIINAYGTNARLGEGDWMVVEADESDGTFTRLPATIAVVTNIDPEHLDFYGSFDALKAAFESFVQNIPFYGFGVLCLDHPEVQALIPRLTDRRIVTYGFSPQADIRGINLRRENGASVFDVVITPRPGNPLAASERRIDGLRLPMAGPHNIQNALAAIAVANEMALDDDVLHQGLGAFGGVKRRFTRTGEAGGITIIDDYGHHPVEIAAVLKAAREETQGRVIAVVQPHRYSRVAKLFEEFCTCFNDADMVIVSDIYAAGEPPLPGIDRDALVEGLRRHGHRQVLSLENAADLPDLVAARAMAGDYVVCLGAGTVTGWAQALPAALAARLTGTPESNLEAGPGSREVGS